MSSQFWSDLVKSSPLPKAPVEPIVAVDMDFPTAMASVLEGKKVRRAEWPDPMECIYLAPFDEDYLVLRKPDRSLHAIMLRGVDMKAVDWEIVRDDA